MAQVLVNIRMDDDLKKSMEYTCQVSIDPFYSDSNITAIDEAAKQVERGKVVVKTIEELEVLEKG